MSFDAEVIASALRATLVRPNGSYAGLDVVASTGSTNVDVAAAAQRGAADRSVLIAGEQTAGQGRRSRGWSSPTGGLYCSVLFRPHGVPATKLGWLTLLAGVALVDVAAELGVAASVKWPNDLLIGDPGNPTGAFGKCAGVLAQVVPDGTDTGAEVAVVLGIGLNIVTPQQKPPAGAGGLPATSLAEHGARSTELITVATALLRRLDELESRWVDAGGDATASGLLADYRRCCSTIGQRVRIELPAGEIRGVATDIDDEGQLVIDTGDGSTTVSAGDVVHLRAVR